MKTKDLISIIIPVYNRPVLVAECLDSVLAQTNPNWECIVVDDGSTDNTWQVLEEYASKDDRIRIFKRDREPKNANTCRNIGAEKAHGNYFLFLDSDDLLGKNCIRRRLSYIKYYPELDFLVFSEANFEKNTDNYYFARKLFSEEEDLIRFFKSDNPWITTGPLWKKTFFFKNNCFNEYLESGQDWDFNIRALLISSNYKKFKINKVDLFQRRNLKLNSISNDSTIGNIFKNKIIIFKDIIDNNSYKAIIEKNPQVSLMIINYYLRLLSNMAVYNKQMVSKNWLFLYESGLITKSQYKYWLLYLTITVQNHKLLKKTFESIAYRFLPKINLLS